MCVGPGTVFNVVKSLFLLYFIILIIIIIIASAANANINKMMGPKPILFPLLVVCRAFSF